jgi:ATP-dependent HslUV protease, peptidase subunit HslV
VLSIRKAGKVVVIADGQVSLGSTVIKPNARKVRRIKDSIVVGFAGATADCLTLFERLELKLEEYPGTTTTTTTTMRRWW